MGFSIVNHQFWGTPIFGNTIFLKNIKILVPFYSRHSSDGRDRFLGGIHDEEEYDQFMKMIFISSTFADEIKVIMIVQKRMSYRLQGAKKKD